MSMTEFYQWCGYLRRNPVGWRWLSREFASLKREVAMGRMARGSKVPPLDHYQWKPPEPLFYQRKKREAEKK